MPYCRSRAAMSSAPSQMGTSTATVTESLASMNLCKASCRSRLLPTAGMMSAAVRVMKFSFDITRISAWSGRPIGGEDRGQLAAFVQCFAAVVQPQLAGCRLEVVQLCSLADQVDDVG